MEGQNRYKDGLKEKEKLQETSKDSRDQHRAVESVFDVFQDINLLRISL